MRRLGIAVVLLSVIGAVSESEASGRRRAVRQPAPGGLPPLAVADSYSLGDIPALTIPPPGVLTNDTANGASIASFGPSTGAEQIALGSPAQTARGGSLTLFSGGGFSYTPAPGFIGEDTFRYVLRNGGGTSSATVTITVSATQAMAVDDTYTTAPESALHIPPPGVLTNDTLAGGRIASFGGKTGHEQTTLGASSPTLQGGSISLASDGSFTYTPPPTTDDGYGYSRPFLGSDSFLYIIQRESLFASATVDVAVEVPAGDADFVVTTPGHYYAMSGLTGENPLLQLTRGKTYKFEISVSPVHPFAILDAPPGSVTNNNITQGTLTFTVPLAAENYRYRCTTHGFGNGIVTVP